MASFDVAQPQFVFEVTRGNMQHILGLNMHCPKCTLQHTFLSCITDNQSLAVEDKV